MHNEMWDEITYPFTNLYSATGMGLLIYAGLTLICVS